MPFIAVYVFDGALKANGFNNERISGRLAQGKSRRHRREAD
jgi:hypothetical protein